MPENSKEEINELDNIFFKEYYAYTLFDDDEEKFSKFYNMLKRPLGISFRISSVDPFKDIIN